MDTAQNGLKALDNYTTLPDETVIYYSKRKNYLAMASYLIGIVVGFCLVGFADTVLFSPIVFICGYYVYVYYNKAKNTQPQVVVSIQGIKTISKGFYEWCDISNACAIKQGYSRNIHYYLVYNCPGGKELLKIDDFNIDYQELDQLLRIYRMQYGIMKKREALG